LNGTHVLLAFFDGINILGKNTNTIKKNTEALLETSRKFGLEVNTEETKDMAVSHHRNARQNNNLVNTNKPFKAWQRASIC